MHVARNSKGTVKIDVFLDAEERFGGFKRYIKDLKEVGDWNVIKLVNGSTGRSSIYFYSINSSI